jgi:hypothetical protein
MAKSSNSAPRISLNKSGEFTTAKTDRQRQILRDQKYPADYMGMYYREASEAISQCIASGLQEFSGIQRAISVLGQMNPQKIGTQRRINSNLDALESFEAMLDKIDLKGAVPSLGDHSPEKLVIQNVEISVRPEILLKASSKGNAQLVGAVKLHFPHTFSLS